MAAPTRGYPDHTERTRLTSREIDDIVRDLARILCSMRKGLVLSREEAGKDRSRGFVRRILIPSRALGGAPSEKGYFHIESIAKMHLVNALSQEMSYDKRRKFFFAAHIVKTLEEASLSGEELAASIRTFLRRYPRPLHVPGYRPPPTKDD